MKLGRVLLFLGGKYNLDFIRDYIRDIEYDKVVCADAGLKIAYELGIGVDFVFGDYDSVDDDILAAFRSLDKIEIFNYPSDKDYTDTHLAIEWILENELEEVVIFGATGGRLDHFFANVNELYYFLERDIKACIVDEDNKIFMKDKSFVIKKDQYKYISFLAYTDEVKGFTLKGFKYIVEDYLLKKTESRAISNEFVDGIEKYEIDFDKGIVLVNESMD